MNNKQLISQFKLPLYVQGKSFADASKVISEKFKGRNDMISNNTKNELLKRLADAQEYSKSQEQQVQQEQMAWGGFADSTMGQAFGEDATGEQKNAAVGAGLNIATTALDLGMTAFGKPTQDTSGLVASAPVNGGSMIAGNAIKGAQAGMAFGPLGAGIGAAVGGVAGLLGAGKAKKAAIENNNNFAIIGNNKLSDNYYALGGEVNQYGDGGPVLPKPPTADYDTNIIKNVHDYYGVPNSIPGYGKVIGLNTQKYADIKNNFTNGVTTELPNVLNKKQTAERRANIYKDMGLTSEGYKYNPLPIEPVTKGDPIITPTQTKAGFEAYADAKQQIENKTKSSFGKKVGDAAKATGKYLQNNVDLLRYAPAVANAYQLSQLKKPQGVRLDRMDNRYRPDYVDLAQQQNIVNQELNNTNSAIQQSGASQGQSRNAMLASQLNKTKALSNAYMNAQAQNAQQNATAQQFNLGVDQTNLNQSNTQRDINARLEGNYDTRKSQMISDIATNLRDVGKEEFYKKVPESMGLNFDWKGRPKAEYTLGKDGKYRNKEGEEYITLEEYNKNKTNSTAKGGYLETLNTINTMYNKRNSK